MDNFYEITQNLNPELVDTVSEFRHYINCHGITGGLIKHFKTNPETLSKICDNAFGSSFVKNLVNNKKALEAEIIKRVESDYTKFLALEKNNELVESLRDNRKSFCGIGTNKIKRRLNKLAKSDSVAKAYRLMLETEDKNIQAKDSYWKYKDKIYAEKHKLINTLIDLCRLEGYIFGKQKSDVRATSNIIYFDLPNCRQISFHCTLDNANNVPDYTKEWDGEVNSTLTKLEEAILNKYPEIIDSGIKNNNETIA